MKFGFLFMVFCIDSVITKHFKVLFRDMYNQSFYEIKSRNTFGDSLIIFVSGVMKSNIISVIVIDARSCNYRSAKISADVFDGNIRFTKIRLSTNVETIGMFRVHFVFDFTKRFADFVGQLFEKNFAKRITEETKIKVFTRTPDSMIASTAFGNKSVNMRIPFQITTESMKNQNETRCEKFGFVLFMKHTKNDISNRMKETV